MITIKPFRLSAIVTSVFFLCCSIGAKAQPKAYSLNNIQQGQLLNGFKAVAIYLNDADKPMGGRFVHVKTGFTLDLLQMESVPQAFIYVNTFPVSNNGEPHTQEHLLITKGNKGHELNTRTAMSLAQSNAFTAQLHTVYDFDTDAGAEVFYTLFEKHMDALLYPDYTEEEVKREVRNWGITENADKTLRLEEKGSVYNEMSSTMDNPYSLLYDEMFRMQYGPGSPNSYNSGGLPSGIRVLNAAAIAKFHQDNYYPGNMGVIASLPKSMGLESVLTRMNSILDGLNKNQAVVARPAKKLPPPHPAENGKIEVVEFPSENAQQPGTIMLSFPPMLALNTKEVIEMNNFLSVFAGDATTNLYKVFIDSKTKIPGIEAESAFAYLDLKQGNPVSLGIDGVKTEYLTKEKAIMVRAKIIEELKKVAAYPDHSAALLEFNGRFKSSLESWDRGNAKFINSPPKFGFRDTGDSWFNELMMLDDVPGFAKSVTLKPQLAILKKELVSGVNIWKPLLAKLNLDHTLPYIVITRANPALVAKSEKERKERADAEVARLKKMYNVTGDQDAILRYKAAYDSNTVVLEKAGQSAKVKFIQHPPLTLDEQLKYKQETLAGNVPLVSSIFDNMSSATTGIALNLNSIPQDKLVYLAMLPDLLTQTGIIKDGKSVSYEDMILQIQHQILYLSSYYSNNTTTGRSELVIAGAGNNVTEAKRSVQWINDVLQNPNWTVANLSRIRDLVDQDLSAIRKTMQGAEESWVSDPGAAWLVQNKPLQLATSSFLTRAYAIFRLKWMLKDSGTPADGSAIAAYLTTLADAGGGREPLQKLLNVITADKPMSSDSAGVNKKYADAFNALPETAKPIVKDAGLDLLQLLNDIPDTSLTTDWKSLCNTIRNDLAQTPAKTLAELNAVKMALLKTSQARVYTISSAATSAQLRPGLDQLVAGFDKTPAVKQTYTTAKLIAGRVNARLHNNDNIVYAGLINPDSHTGVFINSAPLVTYKDTSRTDLLKYLASKLYAGGGKQSVYSITIGAGLAYSNGVGGSPGRGRVSYYAERTPELPQTLSYVIKELKKAPVDTSITDYVVSLVFGAGRSGDDYEARGEAMAADFADGLLPEDVKQFRLAVLKLRREPGLINEVYKHKDEVYQTILPGYGAPEKDVVGGSYFVIGPEKQMVAYETYLKSVDGTATNLYRLYPRDFWLVDDK